MHAPQLQHSPNLVFQGKVGNQKGARAFVAATGHESKQLSLTPLKVLVRVGLHLGVWHPLEALQQARLVNSNVFPPMPDTYTTSSRLLTGKNFDAAPAQGAANTHKGVELSHK